MPTCTNEQNNLVLGRGRLRFDLLDKNGVPQGERYLGNTPELTVTQDVTTLDHFASDYGVKEMDEQMTLQNTRSGSFTTDNISMENVSIFFGGEYRNDVMTQASDVKEILNGGNLVRQGRTYQLGVDEDYPQGLGGIQASSFVIMYAAAGVSISLGDGDISSISGLTTFPQANYEFDAATGELYIEPDAPDAINPIQLVVQYNRLAQTQEMIISSDDETRGALRFVSDNPKGLQKNYFWPLVKLTPNGDYALKGDDWQVMSFNFGVLRKDCATPMQIVYAPGVTLVGTPSISAVAVPTSIVADNTATSTITVTVLDGQGTAAPNQDVTFATTLTGATLSKSSGVTDSQGKVTLTVKGTTAGTANVQSKLVSTNTTVTTPVTLTAP
jgi:hypothetical protein